MKKITAAQRREAEQYRPEVCQLCGRPVVSKLHLDHDHRTGEIRGWVHPLCNWRLGKVRDSIEWMEAAVDYLRRPPLRGRLEEGVKP